MTHTPARSSADSEGGGGFVQTGESRSHEAVVAGLPIRLWNWIGAIAIVLGMFVLYQPAIHGQFIWDDIDNISQSPNMHDLAGLGRIIFTVDSTLQYYPLTFSTFWLQFRFFNTNPTGYHVVNILAHAGAALLIWNILVWMRVRGIVAWGIAALFAWHPTHAESVAWITEFKNTFMGILSAASIAAYMRFDATAFQDSASADSQPVRRRWGWYVVSLVLFAMAMLAKTAVVPLPAALLAVIWWRRGRFVWREVAPVMPLFAVCLPLAGLTIWVERYLIATQWVPDRPTLFERIFIAGRTFWFYIWKDLYPYGYTFVYPLWRVDPKALAWLVFPVSAAALIVVLWLLRRRIGRGPLAGIMFYGIMLSPTMGFVDIYFHRYSYVSDHFQYQASLGIFALMIFTAAWLGKKLSSATALPALPVVVIAAFYAVHTPRQAAFFKDEATLWRSSLKVNDDAWLCHSSIGLELIAQGNYELGEAACRRALELYPKAPEVYHNLGVMRVRQNRIDEAILFFQDAIRVLETAHDSHFYLGTILSKIGKPDEALSHLTRAVELRPKDDRMRLALARQLIEMNRDDKAAEHLALLIKADDSNAQAHYLMAVVHRMRGDPRRAIGEYEATLRLVPEAADVHNELGELLLQVGRGDDAKARFREALRLDPIHEKARKNLDAP